MADLTLILLETGGYALYDGGAYLMTGELTEIGDYVTGTYGVAYTIAIG